MRPVLRVLLLGLGLAALPHPAHAQSDDSSLTEAETERIRDTSYNPSDRVAVFIKILDDRTHQVQDLLTKPRHPGRENTLHDLFAQIGAIADELNDNLDEYTAKHRDVRKALPKLLEATDRWATALRAAAPDERYDIARHLALASVRDAHEAAATLGAEQAAYFHAHPEAVPADKAREEHAPH
jgi:hypothetical protein